jgi:hypothetical protein
MAHGSLLFCQERLRVACSDRQRGARDNDGGGFDFLEDLDFLQGFGDMDVFQLEAGEPGVDESFKASEDGFQAKNRHWGCGGKAEIVGSRKVGGDGGVLEDFVDGWD